MSVIYVSTSAQLVAAASAAKAGDVISLASGTYSSVYLGNLNFASKVTITSTNADNPAVLTGLNVQNSNNLAFTNLDLVGQPNGTTYDFLVQNSSNITFDHVEVSGPALGSGGEKAIGLYIRDSNSVTVTNSEFHDLVNGINLARNTGVTISDNSFHDIRADGVQSSGTSQIVISNNLFTDFHPLLGDHPDAIQFHTVGQTTAASDITVTGNVVARGTGGAIQGIFITDQTGVKYNDVTISDNLLVGTMWNGITLMGATSGSVDNNTVLGFSDMKAYLRVENCAVTLADNAATAFVTTAYASATPPGNTLLQVPTDYGVAALSDWYSTHALPGAFDGSTAALIAEIGLALSIQTTTVADPTEPPSDTTPTTPVDSKIVYTGTDGADSLDAEILAADIVIAKGGNDTLYGKLAGAELWGGAGNDTYYIRSAGDVAIENAGEGSDSVFASIDYTLGADLEQLSLTGTAIKGTGNGSDNQIIGNGLSNVLDGLSGNDTLKGGKGDDTLRGGTGNDSLEGGVGQDVMEGGEGADVFSLNPESVKAKDFDQILDFETGIDKIALSLIDANTKTRGNGSFNLIGDQDFHKSAGELQVKAYENGVIVAGDVNGDGAADFRIQVVNVMSLSANDFLL